MSNATRKRLFGDLKVGTAEYVVGHAKWREKHKHKKGATLSFRGQFNPRKALQMACQEIQAGAPWYDTKEGIAQSLKNLEGLNKLILERHKAGYYRNERLNEFFILGRYSLDLCGNCCKATGKIPKEISPHIPDVLTKDEFWKDMRRNAKKDTTISFSFQDNISSPNLKCVHCGEGWDIINCHDTVVQSKTETFSLKDFVGKSLRMVKRGYRGRTDAIYGFQPEILIRNDKHIDLTPNPEYPSLKMNEFGWLGEKDGITNDYIIQDGDEGYCNVWRYYHQVCNRERLSRETETRFKMIFEKAGFKNIEMKGIPNEYCSCDHCAPWFNVDTKFGIIKVGWRKRVIVIDWEKVETVVNGLKLDPLSLFVKEDVTKGEHYIHAWDWDKAQEYLSRICTWLSVINGFRS